MNEETTTEDSCIEPGTHLEHFRVERILGQGGMGEVYLARDTLLGRRVALKVVRPEALGTGDAVQRFLHEARTTARFSHPHIVSIYSVGEHEGSPYVALEYLDGQTLRQRIDEERPGPRQAVRLGTAIAEALAEAHGAGVLHRDLKPENVLIPRDGRLRVLDFGLAKSLDSGEVSLSSTVGLEVTGRASTAEVSAFESRGVGLRGTPAYMAPEQWREEEVSAAADVWALGVVMFELLAGKRPFSASGTHGLAIRVAGPDPAPSLRDVAKLDGLPEAVVDCLDACLSKDATARPSSREVADVLAAAVHPARSHRKAADSPFRGLQPFGERHADLFFGREAEIDAFLEQLREQAVLPIVGPSGAGKSSFVRAGVLPRLRELGPVQVIRMRPGAHPFETLAAALAAGGHSRVSSPGGSGTEETLPAAESSAPRAAETAPPDTPQEAESPQHLASVLRQSPAELAARLQAIADNTSGRVVLVVDQLEELATLTEDAGERDAFMHALATAADDPDLPVRVIFTLRDDYLGRLASSAAVRRAFARVTVLERPRSAALKAILVQPLRAVGYKFEDDDLPGEMVAEVVEELSALPLLQFAGRQLWERRDELAHRLTRRAYAELGGVSGALARHADGLLAGLTPEQEDGARQMLLRLVTSEGTRQVVGEPDLLEGLPTGAREVLHLLVRGRLLSVRRGDARKPAEYELVHESLIRTWSRLQRWLDESREELTFLAEARQAAARWARQGRRDSELWQGHALLDAERALRHLTGVVPAGVEAFLTAGRRQATRRRRRFRILMGVLIAGLVVLAAVFRIQERRASSARGDAERQSAHARKQTAVAVHERGKAERRQVDLEIATALAALKAGRFREARARTRRALTARDDVRARALWWRLQREPLQWSRRTDNGSMTEIALSSDGAELLVTSGTGTLLRMDSRSGFAHEHNFKDAVVSPIYLPGGRRMAVTAVSSKRLLLLDRKTGKIVRAFKLAKGLVRGIFTGPRGQVLGVAESKGLRLFQRDRTEPWKVIPFGTQPGDLARTSVLSADRRFLATLHFDRGVRIWSLPEGRLLQRLPNRAPAWDNFALSARGSIVALPLDRKIRVWHRQRPNRPVDIPTLSPVNRMWFLADDRLMILYSSGQLALHDPASGKRLTGFKLPKGPYRGIQVDPQSRWLVTCTAQGQLELRSLKALLSPVPRRGGHSPIERLRYSPDWRYIASGEESGAVRLWDARTGRERSQLSWHRSAVHRLAFSPNGRRLATGSLDGALRIWDPASGRLLTAYQHDAAVAAVAFSPDGRWLVGADNDAFVHVRHAKTGGLVHRHRERYGVTDVVFSRDGRRLLVLIGGRKAVHLYETRGWRRIQSFTLPAVAHSLDYHPDGSRFAVGLVGGTVSLVPIAGGKPRTLGRLAALHVLDLRFDRSGRILAATSGAEQRVWDVQTGRGQVRLAAPFGSGYSLDLDPTGRALLVGHSGYPRVLDARTGLPRWRTALVLPRADRVLSQRGWEHLDGSPATDPAPGKAWAAAVKSRAVYASASPDEALVCLVTPDHQVELWDVARDRRLWRRTLERSPAALAVTRGCVVHELEGLSQSTTLMSRTGEVKRWGKLLAVVPVGSRGSLLMAENHLKVVDSQGRELERRAVQGKPYAAVLLGTRHAAARQGRIEIYARPQAGQGATVRLQGVPATDAPTFLAAGPADTLLAGFDSGQVFLWDQRTGERLLGMKLQGAVFHVQRRLARMHVFTFTGDRGTLDLTDLERPYCALLREVWREVPFGWARGAVVLAASPKGHRCLR